MKDDHRAQRTDSVPARQEKSRNLSRLRSLQSSIRAGLFLVAIVVIISIASAAALASTAPRTIASVDQRKASSTLIIAAPEAPDNVDLEQTTGAANFDAMANTMRPLLQWATRKNKDGLLEQDFSRLAPQLVQKWEASKDLRTFKFTFRQGLMSHAGNELTSADYKYTWERLLGLKISGSFFGPLIGLTKPSQISTPSKYVAVVKLPKPSPLFLPVHTHAVLYILDSADMKAHSSSSDPWSKEWLAKNPSGWGPYKITDWIAGQSATFVADPGYAKVSAPSFTTVIYKAVPQSANRLSSVQTGAVGVALNLSPRELSRLSSVSSVAVKKYTGNSMYRMPLNWKQPPFDNPLVRQAVAYAVPYKAILDSVFLGFARPMDDVVAPTYPGYAAGAFSYKTNLVKARALLKQAGFSDGFKFDLAYGTDSPVNQQVAVLIQTYLAKVGIKAELSGLPQGTLSTRTYSKKVQPAWVHVDQALVPDGGYSDGVWFNSTQFYDYNNYKNPTVDRLLVKSNFEPNPAKRNALVKQANRLIGKDISWVCLAFTGFQVVTQKDIAGPVWNASNTIRFDTLKQG